MTTRINGKALMRHDIRRREMKNGSGSGKRFGGVDGFLVSVEDHLTPIERLWDKCHAPPKDDHEGRCAVLREMRGLRLKDEQETSSPLG